MMLAGFGFAKSYKNKGKNYNKIMRLACNA